MKTLNYSTAADLIAAFNSGVKFEVHYLGVSALVTHKSIEAVKAISLGGIYGLVVHTQSAAWKGFMPSGEHAHKPWRLVVCQGSARTPADEPLLKRFLAGETFHVPKTGEVLHEVTFKGGELLVTLKDPKTGALRTTPRYNHEGKHKYRPERTLVAGMPPKPTKAVKIKVYKHAYNGSLFVIREGEVIPNIRGINNAKLVGETTINE